MEQKNLFELTDEEQQNELNKQEKTRDAVNRIVQMLREIDTLNEDIAQEASSIESMFGTKKAKVIAMAKEKHNATSSKAIEKNSEVIEQLKSLFGEE